MRAPNSRSRPSWRRVALERIPPTGPIPRVEHPVLVADGDLQEQRDEDDLGLGRRDRCPAAEGSAEDERNRDRSQHGDPGHHGDDGPEATTEGDRVRVLALGLEHDHRVARDGGEAQVAECHVGRDCAQDEPFTVGGHAPDRRGTRAR